MILHTPPVPTKSLRTAGPSCDLVLPMRRGLSRGFMHLVLKLLRSLGSEDGEWAKRHGLEVVGRLAGRV